MRVLVAGGGAVGLCIAEALTARGTEVVLCERGRVGAGASAGNAGWITPSLALPVPAPGVLSASLRRLGDRGGALSIHPALDPAALGWLGRFLLCCRPGPYRRGLLALQALADEAPRAFERIAARGVSAELHTEPLVYPAFTAAELDELTAVMGDLARVGRGERLVPLTAAEIRAREPGLAKDVRGGMLAPDDLRLRPESLVAGLREVLEAREVRVREGTPLQTLRRERGGWRAAGELVDAVVLANGVDAARVARELGVALPVRTAKGYSRTYPATPEAPRHAVYLEAAKVAISPFAGAVRVSGVLALGAPTLSIAPRRLAAITAAAARAFPHWALQDATPVDWAGMRALTPDGLPCVGPLPGRPGVWVATGHATLGITLAPLTAELVAAGLLDGESVPPAVDLRRFTR